MREVLSSVAAMLMFASSSQGAAVESPAAAPAPAVVDQLVEVVVTAQKRSENLQDVPIAISAIAAKDLADTGVQEMTDLQLVVPGLNVINSGARLTMSLRGIGTSAINNGIENPVALYVDGVYYASTAASILSFNNIDRIEVLKGPQGTLFGRNATGGLVQVITKEPTQTVTGSADLTYANYQTGVGNLYIAGGMAPNLAADLAVHAKTQGQGWGRDLSDGRDVYKVDRDISVRSKWVYTPWDNTKFILTGDFSEVHDSITAPAVRGGSFSPYQPAAPQPDLGYGTYAQSFPVHTLKEGGLSLRWIQQLGDLQFQSISAYQNSSTHIGGDLAASQVASTPFFQDGQDRQFSQELQLSRAAGRLKWSMGLFYIDVFSSYDPLYVDLSSLGFILNVYSKTKIDSEAGYAQATYEVFDNTNITVGGRFTEEKHKAFDETTNLTFPAINTTAVMPSPDDSISFNKFTYRFALDHRFSDAILAYASINSGFRSGGYNIATPGSPPFGPETIKAYELGIKTDLFDRHLRIDAGAFYYDYKGLQTQKYINGSTEIINAAGASSYGFDVDLAALVTSNLRISAGASLINPKYGRFNNCLVGGAQGGVPLTPGNCSGNQLNLATKASFNLAADYTIPVFVGTLDLNANTYFNDGFYPESDNVIHQDRYAEVGARAKWTAPGDHAWFALYGRNLTNRRVLAYGATQAVGTQLVSYQEPRTYGITVGYSF